MVKVKAKTVKDRKGERERSPSIIKTNKINTQQKPQLKPVIFSLFCCCCEPIFSLCVVIFCVILLFIFGFCFLIRSSMLSVCLCVCVVYFIFFFCFLVFIFKTGNYVFSRICMFDGALIRIFWTESEWLRLKVCVRESKTEGKRARKEWTCNLIND